MGGRRTAVVLVTLLVAAAARIAGQPATGEPAPEYPRVHTDGAAMARAANDAMAALMRDDAQAVGPAVRRIEEACRELFPDEDAAQGPGVRNRDQALHKVLTGTRLYASRGDLEEAFTEFVWVLRTCRECHAIARRQGRLPATGPLWESRESGAPAQRAETAQSPDAQR